MKGEINQNVDRRIKTGEYVLYDIDHDLYCRNYKNDILVFRSVGSATLFLNSLQFGLSYYYDIYDNKTNKKVEIKKYPQYKEKKTLKDWWLR